MTALHDRAANRPIWVRRVAPDDYRVRPRSKSGNGQRVTSMEQTADGLVRLHTAQQTYAIHRADYAVPPESTQPPPDAHVTTIKTSDQAALRVKRMTDCIFVLGPKREQSVVLGIVDRDGAVDLQTHRGVCTTDLAALERVNAVPTRCCSAGTAFTWVASDGGALR